MFYVQKANDALISDINYRPKSQQNRSVFGHMPKTEPYGIGQKLNVREPNVFGCQAFTMYEKV